MPPKIREVDLLLDFYTVWKHFHQRAMQGAEMEELERCRQDIIGASHRIEDYRKRHVR